MNAGGFMHRHHFFNGEEITRDLFFLLDMISIWLLLLLLTRWNHRLGRSARAGSSTVSKRRTEELKNHL